MESQTFAAGKRQPRVWSETGIGLLPLACSMPAQGYLDAEANISSLAIGIFADEVVCEEAR